MTTTHRPRYERAAWGTAVEIVDDIWRIRLDARGKGLQVNSYVYRGPDTLAVIDPGWPETIEALSAAMAQLGLARDLREVDCWLYTHSHVDHMGAASLLQRRFGGRHICWEGCAPWLDDLHGFLDRAHDWRDWLEATLTDAMCRALGIEERPRRDVATMVARFGAGPVVEPELVRFGDTIALDEGLRLEVVDARGHDPYHVAFWSAEREWLFSGDVVLAVPTPLMRVMRDDVALYEASLRRLEALRPSALCPGHGMHQLKDVSAAFERSARLNTSFRLGALQALEQAGAPLRLDEIVAHMARGQRLRPMSRALVFVGNTESHLHELARRGEVAFDGERFERLR